MQDPTYLIEERYWEPTQRINVMPRLENMTEFLGILDKLPPLKQKFKGGIFGHFLNLNFKNFPSKIMHHLVLRRVPSGKKQLRFNIQGREMSFGEEEFAIVTGLNFGPFPKSGLEDSPTSKKLLLRFFHGKDKICLTDLTSVLNLTISNSPVLCSLEELLLLTNLYFLEAFFASKG